VKLTESNIPELIKTGRDKEAIQSLYKNVLPNVKKYIRNNSGSNEDAFDIFQDALLSFYQSVMENKFDVQYKVYGYVYKLCVYRWINKAQRERLQFKEELPDVRVEEPKAWFSENEPKDEEALLRNLFSSLGEKCLELLNYTIYKGMLLDDIMLRMNFQSAAAVRMQHMRCKEKLMTEMKNKPEILFKLRGL
jgi:RNA polymerase sigma factor (sigma-70 family)